MGRSSILRAAGIVNIGAQIRAQAKKGYRVPLSNEEYSDRWKSCYPPDWAQISFECRKRAAFKCQAHKLLGGVPCGVQCPPPFHGRLVAHHIESLQETYAKYGWNPPPAVVKRLNSQKNLMCLCHHHHMVVHGRE